MVEQYRLSNSDSLATEMLYKYDFELVLKSDYTPEDVLYHVFLAFQRDVEVVV